MSRRSIRRIVAAAVICAVGVAVVPDARRAVLRAAGVALMFNDPIESADVGVMASGEGGELEVSDLYLRGVVPRIVLFVGAPTAVDQEFARRGVQREDGRLKILLQLGVPRGAITTVETGEGGTTESTQALATWARLHPNRVVVVVDPTHARRYRRTLRRVWPADVPPPRITTPRANPFRAEDWWVSLRTRRDGLFELQKLVWDYVRHPW